MSDDFSLDDDIDEARLQAAIKSDPVDESTPLSDDEFLIRRVPENCFRPSKEPPIRPSGFEPRGSGAHDPDDDGISLFRVACLADPREVLSLVDPGKRSKIGLVAVTVAEIRSVTFGTGNFLTVDKTPMPVKEGEIRVAGHVSIPQLNTLVADDDQKLSRRIAKQLAQFASRRQRCLVDPTTNQ